MALQEEFKSQGNYLFKYRGSLPLVILLVGLAVFVQHAWLNRAEIPTLFDEIYKYVCLAVSLLGLLVRIYTVGHTPKDTSGRNTSGQLAEVLNTSGIYSTVRHPLYVGNFLMWLGIGMLSMNVWFIVAFILAYWVYYERIMYAEEAFLRTKFGDSYMQWSEKTPAFIPSCKNWSKPLMPFSWKKILKKEKNGVAALFTLFFMFEFIETSIAAGQLMFKLDFWSIACMASLVIYFILKFIKHKTAILHEEGR